MSIDIVGASNSVKENFRSFLAKLNLPEFDPIPDDHFHKFKDYNDKSCWYRASQTPNGLLSVNIGNWATGEKFYYPRQRDITPEQAHEINVYLKKSGEKQSKKQKEDHTWASERARHYWEISESTGVTRYMHVKGIRHLYGARVLSKEELVVPMMIDDVLHGLQTIYPDGGKEFIKNQRMKGTYFTIGAVTENVLAYLVEGFATGISVHEATGSPVIVAFNAYNLIEVAKHFSGYKIIVAADNDRKSPVNIGLVDGEKAANILGQGFTYPTFEDNDFYSSDFNDLYRRKGVSVVTEQLKGNLKKVASINKKEKKEGHWSVLDRLTKALQHDVSSNLPEFPHDYKLLEPNPGVKVVYKVTDNRTLLHVADAHATDAILSYCRDILAPYPKNEAFLLDYRASKNAMLFFKSATAPLTDKVPVTVEKDDPRLSFHRLPFNFESSPSGCPTWDELFTRIGNSEALKEWIGSLFDEESDRQQYVWLSGGGQDGKGSIARFLADVFGDAYMVQYVAQKPDNFWTSQFLHKRIVVFPDCNNYNFPTSGLFKSLTGGDRVKIEFKGQQAFTASLNAKIMFLSNENPNIEGTKADTRRLIYCPMKPGVNLFPEAVFQKMLWGEGAHFLSHCIKLYTSKYPSHGSIIIKKDDGADFDADVESLVSQNEERYRTFFDSYLKYDEDKIKLLDDRNRIDPDNQNYAEYPSVRCENMYRTISGYFKNDHEIKRMYQWLARTYRVERKRISISAGVREWHYIRVEISESGRSLLHAKW